MTDGKGFEQQGQNVQGPQTNVGGNVEDVFSGQFSGTVIYKPTYHQKAEGITSLPTIPDPPSDFTGREEELKELLKVISSGTNIIGLRGIGGVGKTALALKLVESIKDSYPDGRIMVDMMGTTNPISPAEAMGFVIHSYHREEKISAGEAEIMQRYFNVLNGKRALLLLDIAFDDKQVLKLIPPKSCSLIITSRKTIKLPGLFKKDLDVLKPDEALELLLNVCCPAGGPHKSPREDPAWPEIVRLCGYLPLALRAAGSYLANSDDISPKKYAVDLNDERSRLEMIGEQGVEMSVDASFNLSFQKLESRFQQTFLDLSIFPADFDAQAEEQICQDEGHKGLSELVRWSFVDYKPQGPDYGRYKLHDLARLFASARQPDESKAIASERHSTYYKELLSEADALYQQGGSGIQRGEGNALGNLGNAYAALGDARKAIEYHEQALAIAREIGDRRKEGAWLGNLGIAYAALGDARKAIEYYEQHLVIAREIGDRRGEGAALGNLGLAHVALGDARKAIEYYEQHLTIACEIGDRRGEGNALWNSSLALYELDKQSEAIEKAENALQIYEQIESPTAARVMQQLAEWKK